MGYLVVSTRHQTVTVFPQLVVPASWRKTILKDNKRVIGGHVGEEKTLAQVKERYYWPGHYNDVKN